MSSNITPHIELDPCSAVSLSRHPPLDGRSDKPDDPGVSGFHCNRGVGVSGGSVDGTGVTGEGVHGVVGKSMGGGRGVTGISKTGEGVYGETNSNRLAAVTGNAVNPRRASDGFPTGVWGSSISGEGVHGESRSDVFAAVAGIQLNPNSSGAGIYGEHKGNGPAGFFNGNVVVTKDIFMTNADCAEDFDFSQAAITEPGTVMVLNQNGELQESREAYDKKVAGIVSGAGSYKPAIVLDRRESKNDRIPIALVGKVYCKVDAGYSPIEVGDLLTTSATPGHAMKALDPARAFGSVIGKALRSFADGTGLIPVLVALQ
jgi:hypothetical protein